MASVVSGPGARGEPGAGVRSGVLAPRGGGVHQGGRQGLAGPLTGVTGHARPMHNPCTFHAHCMHRTLVRRGEVNVGVNGDRVRLKRAYEPASPDDGAGRAAVGRGSESKAEAALDDGAKEVAPSPELRTWYGHEVARWPEFRRRYLAELAGHGGGGSGAAGEGEGRAADAGLRRARRGAFERGSAAGRAGRRRTGGSPAGRGVTVSRRGRRRCPRSTCRSRGRGRRGSCPRSHRRCRDCP